MSWKASEPLKSLAIFSMKKITRYKTIKLLPLVLIALVCLIPILGQAYSGPEFGEEFGLPSGSIEDTAKNIVNVVLSSLGLITVILIIYGGVVWMTAGGNEEKITKAKKVITSAIIGLAIILLAWSIFIFTLTTVNSVTGGGGPINSP